MATKLCILCRKAPATLPDRYAAGRMTLKVCRFCHAARLAGDVRAIMRRRLHRDS